MDAFDADVLIYSIADDARGVAVRRSLSDATERIGSSLLLIEVLMKPMRAGLSGEVAGLEKHLAMIDLKPAADDVVEAALGFSVKYGLKAADSIHLATAVLWGAERFHTNNRRDFGPHITEIEVVYPGPSLVE